MRILASWIFVGCLLPFAFFSVSAWNDGWPVFANSLFILAIVFVAIATVGRLWCSLYIAGRKQQILVTDGPYSLCRNPLYFFSLIGAIGVGLASQTLTIPIVVAAAFLIYYPFVIRREEKVLLELHGDAYRTYAQKVPRFIPSFKNFSEPASYNVSPIIFRRHCFSAIWFVWILAIPVLADSLHQVNFLQTYFKLY